MNFCLYGIIVAFDDVLQVLIKEAFHSLRSDAAPDLFIQLKPEGSLCTNDWSLWWRSWSSNARGDPEFCVFQHDSGALKMVYDDGVSFTLDSTGTHITVAIPEYFDLESLLPALMGPVLGVALRLRGTTCLHASAVVVNGQALGLVGVSGAGKSSTAAALAMQGWPVLTDDVLALMPQSGAYAVAPAYPRLRLWPSSVRSRLGSEDRLPRMMPTTDKRILALDGSMASFHRLPAPLSALYFLEERTAGAGTFSELRPATALMRLIADSYASRFLSEQQRADEFRQLSRLVQQVKLTEVHAPDDLEQLGSFASSIVEHFKASMRPAV